MYLQFISLFVKLQLQILSLQLLRCDTHVHMYVYILLCISWAVLWTYWDSLHRRLAVRDSGWERSEAAAWTELGRLCGSTQTRSDGRRPTENTETNHHVYEVWIKLHFTDPSLQSSKTADIVVIAVIEEQVAAVLVVAASSSTSTNSTSYSKSFGCAYMRVRSWQILDSGSRAQVITKKNSSSAPPVFILASCVQHRWCNECQHTHGVNNSPDRPTSGCKQRRRCAVGPRRWVNHTSLLLSVTQPSANKPLTKPSFVKRADKMVSNCSPGFVEVKPTLKSGFRSTRGLKFSELLSHFCSLKLKISNYKSSFYIIGFICSLSSLCFLFYLLCDFI